MTTRPGSRLRELSIKTVVVLAFFSLSGLLVLGYSFLSARFFSMGVAHAIMDNMAVTVENFHHSAPGEKRKDVEYWGTYRITTNWKFMPPGVTRVFPTPVPPSNELYIARKPRLSRSGTDYYVMAVEKEGQIYYVSQWSGFSTPLGVMGWNSNKNIRFLIVLSCLIGIGVAVMFWFFMRAVSQPMISLNSWAGGLDSERIREVPPDFHFRELNELAAMLHAKIRAEHEQLERDQQFVHYASHELRTPITVISQNTEVLKKLQRFEPEKRLKLQERSVRRLDRASENMKMLVETLLWVGRKSGEPPPETELRVDRLVREIIRELAFLLRGKNIKLQLSLFPCTVKTAEAPLRIVLSNLIRNAFQHSSRGRVSVSMEGSRIHILNEERESGYRDDLGFGFGLSLTSKLIDRMGWGLECDSSQGRYLVSVDLRFS